MSLTRIQALVCAVAGLGFAFDLYESLMMPLIIGPVLATVGHLTPGTPTFNWWVGAFFFVPVVCGGLVGLIGGYLTDIFGRRRILVWSILLYACATSVAAFATSLPMLLLLRCVTMIGVSVEAVAAIAWLAELFPIHRQREAVLGYTQSCYALGGLAVSCAYYLAVTLGDRLPTILGSHEPWRYTVLSGLIPAVPLILVRPFLPESPEWRDKKNKGILKSPSLAELFQPARRRATLLATLMMACVLALQYGALQHTPRIIPGLTAFQGWEPRRIQQAVSVVYLVQELGSVAGRLLFALLVTRIVGRQRLLRTFIAPALVIFPLLYFLTAARALALFLGALFLAQALFNGLHSFWGNYLPRQYPTHLRGTGESFAMNIGGRVLAVSAALLTTQLANVVPGASAPARLTYAAGWTALLALSIVALASFWLPESESAAAESAQPANTINKTRLA
ncbi:MAG: MFS transporter [Gemmatimonadaceae bacterium]|nr:MFS transporter [Gemmatimonadaceae bacterium]